MEVGTAICNDFEGRRDWPNEEDGRNHEGERKKRRMMKQEKKGFRSLSV